MFEFSLVAIGLACTFWLAGVLSYHAEKPILTLFCIAVTGVFLWSMTKSMAIVPQNILEWAYFGALYAGIGIVVGLISLTFSLAKVYFRYYTVATRMKREGTLKDLSGDGVGVCKFIQEIVKVEDEYRHNTDMQLFNFNLLLAYGDSIKNGSQPYSRDKLLQYLSPKSSAAASYFCYEAILWPLAIFSFALKSITIRVFNAFKMVFKRANTYFMNKVFS